MRTLFGIFFGGLVALAYLFAKVRGSQGGLDLFALGCAASFILHFALSPREVLLGIRSHKMCVRGLLYGMTQYLIFKAQQSANTGEALVSAVMGSLFGVVFGRIYLRERLSKLGWLAFILAFGSFFISPQMFIRARLGLLAGLIQGMALVLSRSLMLESRSKYQSIAIGFLIGGLFSFFMLWCEDRLGTLLVIKAPDLLFVVVVMVVIQYCFFWMNTWIDAPRASILLLSRIPWILFAEHFYLGLALGVPQLLAAGCIVFASVLLVGEQTQAKK